MDGSDNPIGGHEDMDHPGTMDGHRRLSGGGAMHGSG